MQKWTKILLFLTVLFSATTYGQKDYLRKIQNYLQKNESTLRMSASDYSDLMIYDHYYTESMELEHVYTNQRVKNIPVFNAIGNFAFKNGEIIYFANSFQSNLESRINVTTPRLTPTEAVNKAAIQLGLGIAEKPEILSAKSSQEFLLSKAGISLNEIPVKLVYQPTEKNNLRLAWDLSIHTLDGAHWWSVRVDAVTGQVIDKNDWILSCSFPVSLQGNNSSEKIKASAPKTFGRAPVSFFGDGSQYKVFALPVESPDHGNRTLVSEPANAVASPYGWHDTDGSAGAEYTITRGNNVYASEDRDGNDTPGYSPDGGASLDFDFPLNLNRAPFFYLDPAITNLFYMNNMMHDIMYQYGFDEAAGNFQQTNYTTLGAGDDDVIALAQQGAGNGPGNNANFGTPPDGASPYMRMFTWNAAATTNQPQVLTINSPSNLFGMYDGTVAAFGPPVPPDGITGDLALLVDDNSGTSTDPNDACDPIINEAELLGKIVVLRRGICQFDEKVLNAQNAGAIAVIVVNNQPGLTTMSGDEPAVNISSVMITQQDGEAIIAALSAGEMVNGTVTDPGPYEKDGDFDNGVIAHEYGHGISNRLTGGPLRANCLANAEQMGEGWSDFFSLVLTTTADDFPAEPRGIGTFVTNQDTIGRGIRQYPYTTDMTVNPFTYAYVKDQFYTNTDGEVVVSEHGVGSIWATILWDMTWALIDKYGFDSDIYNGTGGNNIALQLVIDGLKLQPCSPGFVDGRDAILAADRQNNDGANQCLIWNAFANRGVGYSASQGSSDSIYDQIVAFDMPPDTVLDCGMGTMGFEESSFQIYPNPTHGIVNIVSSKISAEVQINLFDLNGRKVLSKKVSMPSHATISTSGLSAGIYIMQLLSEGRTQNEKLILQ